jgi:hypothetical protein
VLTAEGEVHLYRARQAQYVPSEQPTLKASSPSETKTSVKGRILTMHFGDKTRNVIFTGREEAPSLRSFGLAAFGSLGELAHLGMEGLEMRGATDRQGKAMDAWLPVLLGQTSWRDIPREN